MNNKFVTEKAKRGEVLDKKFSNGRLITEEFKMLWKEAEWIMNDIKHEKEKVERKIKLAKKKKLISSLELKVREKQEEIELLEKFREELEELERLEGLEGLEGPKELVALEGQKKALGRG